jgi:two-component system sensor histidine kinase/response regulator
LQPALGGAVVVHTDITERWRAEEAAQRSAEAHRTTLAALVEGVVIYDNQGNVIDHNPAAELILGDSLGWMRECTNESAPSKPIWPDGTAIGRSELPLMRVLSSKEPCRHVVMGNRCSDGAITWLVVNAEPVCDAGSADLVSVVVSFTDITDQHLVQQQQLKISLPLGPM